MLAAVGGFADGPKHGDGQRDVCGLSAFAEHVQDLVAGLIADVVDVGVAGLGNPQSEHPQQDTTSVNPPSAKLTEVSGLRSGGWVCTLHPRTRRHGLYFLKVFLYATPRASTWTSVTVKAPPWARMYYVDGYAWTGQETQTRLGMFDPKAGRRAVSFQYCGDHPQGYFGGIVARGPSCVELAVRSQVPGASTHRIGAPIGQRCN